MDQKTWDQATAALHAGAPERHAEGAVAPPIQLTTTFEREGDGSYAQDYSYARRSNPNRNHLEATLAALEGGHQALGFASGTAATMAVFQMLSTGDHALVARECYHGTRAMLGGIFSRWGLDYTFVDMTDLAAVKAALRPKTKLLWVETPSNPTMRITDIAAVAALARSVAAALVVDNTVATPVLQRPFLLGADLIVHSTTKYLNGHSDVLGGAVVVREAGAYLETLREIQLHGGAVPSPFDCWLTTRGVKTLTHRVRAQSATAQAVAERLAEHPKVTAVHYAGLPSHPHHALAARQMTAFGGLLSFEVKGGEKEALAVAAACQLITRATSLGGVESLIEQRASMEGPGTTTPPSLLRLSVGLEAVGDLVGDLELALRVLG